MTSGAALQNQPPATRIEPEAFDEAMARFGPFEPEPDIAVGVSGGPDSLALVLLLDRWCRERGGRAVGMTVDHGLRPDSADEARTVAGWLSARGIAHRILTWDGPKPTAGLQKAARDARYRLLAEACGRAGLLRLAVAHHADDQAETILFRQERASGPDGLAGMPSSRSLGPVQLIRPVLGWRKAALIRTCRDFAQPYLDDPSNRAERFARTALRTRLASAPHATDAILGEGHSAGLERGLREDAMVAAAAACVSIRPEGFALVDPTAFGRLEKGLGTRIIAATLRTIGGAVYARSDDAVERLIGAIRGEAFGGAALGGCLVVRWQDRLLVCREAARIGPAVPVVAGSACRWDGRFSVRIDAADACDLTVGALGATGFAALRHELGSRLPAIVGATLPALRRGNRLVAVPALNWAIPGSPEAVMVFAPLWPLSSERFTVV